MRIEHLGLTAFGPFTDLPLNLSGPGVHVVHGPNEAGKTSALTAMGELLYGFDHRTPYDFVHGKPDLRLDAVLSDGSGTTLEVVRHKRNRNSLTGPDGTPIPEERMTALLNGVTPEVFSSTFALTLKELKRGGQQLIEGRGNLGQALYSARSGRDLRAVLRHLKERQESLYLSSGNARKPAVNDLMLRHKVLQRDLEAVQTRSEAFDRLRGQVKEAAAAVEELEKNYQEAYAEHRRQEKLLRVLPQLRERRRILHVLESLSTEGPLAPPGADERLRRLEQEREQQETLCGRAARNLDSLREQMAGLEVDARLTEAGGEVASLAELLAGVNKSVREWEASERDGHTYHADAVRLWAQVRPGQELGEAGPERVADSVSERIEALAEQHPHLKAEEDSARRQRDAKAEEAMASRAALEALNAPEDDGRLRTVLEQAPVSLEESLRRDRTEAADLSTRLETALAATGWAERWADMDQACSALLSAFAPGRDEVSAYRDRLNDHRARRKTARKEQSHREKQRDKHRGELEDLCSRVDPPTEEDLREHRRKRDELWERIRTEGLPIAATEEGPALARDFEEASTRADTLADRLRNEAEAVNRRLTLESQLRDVELDLAYGQEELAGLASEHAELEREWGALWPDEAVPAPRLNETETLLGRLQELRDLHEKQKEALNALRDTERSVRTVADQLSALLSDSGVDVAPLLVPDCDHAVLLPQLRDLAREERDRRAKAVEGHTAALHRVESDERELERLERDLEQAESALARWSEQWGEAVEAAGFSADTPPQAVRDDLDRLERAAELWTRAREAEGRARRAQQEVEEFDQRVRAVFGICGLTPPQERADRDRELRDLHRRVQDNAEAEHKLSTLQESVAQEEDALADARAALERAEKDLSALLEETGVCDTAALREAIERATKTVQERRSLDQVQGQLNREGDIDRLEKQTAGLDDTTAAARVQAAQEELDELDGKRTAARERHTRARGELERVDGSARAADLAEERAAVTAEIQERVAEYMRLTFAHEILTAQVEAYQQQNQGPVLLRAQDLFKVLTLGRFTGLRPDVDENGAHVLHVVRRGGRVEEVDALSEGTADQLYLALRLASLEQYADANQMMPFVVDDVFMTFDDERAVAALEVLNGMADRFQVVVFTHHDHLADLAERSLPTGRAHLHALPRFEPPLRSAAALGGGTSVMTVGPTPPSAVATASSPGERTCRDCGNTFIHRKRGRPPVLCPECRENT
ncbi:hypothetical protein BJF83_21650 [Nocardiopsis sp. CNR-923]|uniref:YhaN family protein n=1 Tax=Nocardiopsis sp. CNR-923 TaxID=1904965 RepID=UPI0009606E93|nr:YhaN family protein [Nocardiopsis sp. CNR-923]OLT26290.1 hypothetical protein BJF83_21650 [Nocardiopsis sp. CNR-923]